MYWFNDGPHDSGTKGQNIHRRGVKFKEDSRSRPKRAWRLAIDSISLERGEFCVANSHYSI